MDAEVKSALDIMGHSFKKIVDRLTLLENRVSALPEAVPADELEDLPVAPDADTRNNAHGYSGQTHLDSLGIR